MNDGLLGPKLILGHGAPKLKRGLTAGATPLHLFWHTREKVSSSNDPPARAGGPTYLNHPCFALYDPYRRMGRGLGL